MPVKYMATRISVSALFRICWDEGAMSGVTGTECR